jgi:hypothetical protein
VTFKEAFNIGGLPTTWGFPQFKDFVPKEDALIVSRVKQAGAVILGKTNVPFGLADFQAYNDVYGTTNNPWDLGRSPGGSSGGSAAALAAGFGQLSFRPPRRRSTIRRPVCRSGCKSLDRILRIARRSPLLNFLNGSSVVSYRPRVMLDNSQSADAHRTSSVTTAFGHLRRTDPMDVMSACPRGWARLISRCRGSAGPTYRSLSSRARRVD